MKLIVCKNLSDALRALKECTAEQGGKNIVFCEDRLTLLAERAVLSAGGGTFSTEVTTFARFLAGERRVLSKQGSVMKIAALIAENREKLGCFQKGAAQAVYETIAQLSASAVDAAALQAGAEETEGLLRLKLNDLAFLFGEYEAFLRDSDRLDENGYLALLPKALEQGARDAHIVFFAFPSFTRQALEGVRAAFAGAKKVTAVLIDGDAAFCGHESVNAFLRAANAFGAPQRVDYPCSFSEDAKILYEGLFSPEKFNAPPAETEGVRFFEAVDEAAEIDTVCALIKKHVAEGLRYREIAVLVPDETRYLAVEKAFATYRIPFFADRKRPYSEHPFVTFALAVLGAVADGGLPASADAVAANILFGADGNEYRNYLLKYGGWRGACRREIKPCAQEEGYDIEKLTACRARMLAFLGAFPRRGRCAAFVQGVEKLLELTEARRVLEELACRLSGADAAFLRLDPLDGILEELVAVTGGEEVTARDFMTMLQGGASALQISLIPQYADAVFVGDATESKFERAEVLFATGLTEALPRTMKDTALISDRDMGRLSAMRMEIEPTIAVVNSRVRESLALNLCSFRRRLYLSRPLRTAEGETEKSEVLAYAERLFRLVPVGDVFPYDCCEEEPAALALFRCRASFGRGEGGARYSSLFRALEEELGSARAGELLSQGEKPAVPEAAALYFSGEVSPTLLEHYFSCPYAGFMLRGLRLREREERAVQDTDAGTFVHTVLEHVAPRFNEFPSGEACREAAECAARELLGGARFSSLSDTRAGAYTAERLVAESAEAAVAAYMQLAFSAFRVEETEGEIMLPELRLRGRTDRIDRSDEYVRVIDYKTGAIDDRPTSYYTGRKLQLQLYLLGAARGGTAAGAFYFPAAERFSAEGEAKYRMHGFFSKDDGVVSRMDTTRKDGEKSAFFEGGGRTDKGMPQEDFGEFLDYARLVSEGAEREMRAGNIAPSPYEGVCAYCKLLGACAFRGTPRKERAASCADIVKIVKVAKGEEQ